MFNLCALIILFSIFTLQATVVNMGISSGFTAKSVTTVDGNSSPKGKDNASSADFGLASNRYKNFQYFGKIKTNESNYSEYKIYDAKGMEHHLVDDWKEKNEYFLDNTLEYGNEGLLLSGALFGDLVDGPFLKYGFRTKISKDLYNKTSTLGGELTFFHQNAPISYFRDITTFHWKRNKDHINGKKLELFYQQAWGANLKTKVLLFQGERQHERPSHLGGALNFAYATRDDLFFQMHLLHIEENSSMTLLDNRGYFTASSGQITLIYEINYDLLLSANYALAVEHEKNPRNGEHNALGSDTYGVACQYSVTSELVADGNVNYNVTNTAQRAVNFKVGTSWTF